MNFHFSVKNKPQPLISLLIPYFLIDGYLVPCIPFLSFSLPIVTLLNQLLCTSQFDSCKGLIIGLPTPVGFFCSSSSFRIPLRLSYLKHLWLKKNPNPIKKNKTLQCFKIWYKLLFIHRIHLPFTTFVKINISCFPFLMHLLQ